MCGSLQARSSNRRALEVAAGRARSAGAIVADFNDVARIPPFDPDRQDRPPAVVVDWLGRLSAADAVLVAAPEYAGGLAGVVKNAFDWAVGAGSLYRKPLAVISVGTTGGRYARHDLVRTLLWQGGWVIAELGIAAPRTKSDGHGRFTDRATLAAVEDLTQNLLLAVTRPAQDLVELTARVATSLHIDLAHVAPA